MAVIIGAGCRLSPPVPADSATQDSGPGAVADAGHDGGHEAKDSGVVCLDGQCSDDCSGPVLSTLATARRAELIRTCLPGQDELIVIDSIDDPISNQFIACTLLRLKRTAHGGTWVGGDPDIDGGFDLDKFSIGDGYEVVETLAVSGLCRDALREDGKFRASPGVEVARARSVSGWIRVLRSSFDDQMRPTEGGFSLSYEVCGVRTQIHDAYGIMTTMAACRLGL